jgi:hypothetical protein
LLKGDAEKWKAVAAMILIEFGFSGCFKLIEDWVEGVLDDGYTLQEFIH